MKIYLKDNWTRFKYRKNYLYHISSIDRLEGIKRFGLNSVIANVNRRGDRNSGGIYLSSNLAVATECMECDGLDESKMIVFAIPIKKIINNLYIDLEMSNIDDCIGPAAKSSAVDLVNTFPCKYQPNSDYSKYITQCVINKYFFNPEVISEYQRNFGIKPISSDIKNYYNLIFNTSNYNNSSHINPSIESSSKLSEKKLLLKYATPKFYKYVNDALRNTVCFYYTGIIKFSDLEYLGKLVDFCSVRCRLPNIAKNYDISNKLKSYNDDSYSDSTNLDPSNYDDTSDMNVHSKFFVRNDYVV